MQFFAWTYGRLTRVERNAFEGLRELTQIILKGNQLRELFDCTFEGLKKLDSLDLFDNGITTVGTNTFLGLNNLAILEINGNPEFPISTLTTIKSVKELYMEGHTGVGLTDELILQFPSLTYLGLKGVMLNCACEYQWIAKLSTEGNAYIVTNDDGLCVGTDLSLKDPSVYSDCVVQSYRCLDQSFVCPGDNTWYKVDTEDGCNCTYPPERTFYNDSSFVCSDINACEDSSIICQGNCTNTIGSYKCDCHEGFVNLNETFCNDVNECEVRNGGCEHNCINTIGSSECSCFGGFNMQHLQSKQ
ncbi:hypothetical protein LOD99_7712 [Oopsacas minuta]|uniref:EGF-like domain-containing protein n=1 Tax=Oopsacas minuta TaxID=111878 RepID=A0AAV7JPB2_9METZ|nr:hypothetical protein LOD99_7712 [Oopsacas minuta]